MMDDSNSIHSKITEIGFSSLTEQKDLYKRCTTTHYLKILDIKQHRRRNTGRNKPESFHTVVQRKKEPTKMLSSFLNWRDDLRMWRERWLVFAGQRTKEENVDQRSLKVWTELCSVKSSLWVRSTHARLKNRITRRHGRERYLIPSQSLI